MTGFRIKKRIIIPVAAVLMATFIMLVWVGVSYGWFDAVRDTPPETVRFGSVEAYATVNFVNGSGQTEHTLSTGDAYYYAAESSFGVDLFNTGAENYFGKMRINITFRGTIESCIRVVFTEEWKNAAGQIVRQPLTLYGADGSGVGDNSGINGSLWIDLRRSNSIFYYSDISDPVSGWRISGPKVNEYGNQASRSLPLITKGAVFSEPMAGTTLRIGIKVESVQFNRYQEIWGLDSYPTR